MHLNGLNNLKRNKMKETLEDFCTRELSNFNDNVRNTQFDLGFRTGAIIGLRFPKERSYSEEKVLDILREFYKVSSKKDFPLTNTIPLWFEKFKKE
jgi:hypothetical protein